jgi:hypothetical protein
MDAHYFTIMKLGRAGLAPSTTLYDDGIARRYEELDGQRKITASGESGPQGSVV